MITITDNGIYLLRNNEVVVFHRWLPNGNAVLRKPEEAPGYHHKPNGLHAYGDDNLDVLYELNSINSGF